MAIEPLTPERRRQQTRDYLLQAAAQVFAERGFHGASLDEALYAALEASDVPPEDRLPDFVHLVRDQTSELGSNWDILYQEFALYAMRNPAAREKLAEFDALTIDKVADLLRAERARRGIAASEHLEHLARIITALFRGIGIMRALDAEAVDEAFLESAMSFVAEGLTSDWPPPH